MTTQSWSPNPGWFEVAPAEVIPSARGWFAIVNDPGYMSGSGVLTVRVFGITPRSVMIDGPGQLVVDAYAKTPAAVSVSGSGVLSAQTYAVVPVTATLNGSGSLAASAVQQFLDNVSLSGLGSLVATAVQQFEDAVVTSGAGNLVASVFSQYRCAVPLSGVGALTLAASAIQHGMVLLTGVGALLAPAYAIVPASVVLPGRGELSVGAVQQFRDALNLQGTGSLSAAVIQQFQATTALGGAGLLGATTSKVPQALFNVVGSGTQAHPANASTQTWSWTHDIDPTDAAVVAFFDLHGVSGSGAFSSIAATCGGQTMTLLDTQNFSGGALSRMVTFGLLINQAGTPTLSGSQSIVVTANYTSSSFSIYGIGNSSSYSGVSSFGTIAKNAGSNPKGSLVTLSVPAPAANSRIAQAFCLDFVSSGTASSIDSYNENTEWYSASVNNSYDAFLLGDAPGGSTVTFSFVVNGQASSGYLWVGMAVPLNP